MLLYTTMRTVDDIFDSVSPAQINLKSFEEKDILEPKVWNDGMMFPDVRRRLMSIARDFISTFGIDGFQTDDIVVVGSIAGYNWSKYSDIDLHVIADFNGLGSRTEMTKKMFDGIKNDWNNKHKSLNVKGYPVELYVQDINEPNQSDGIYSIVSDMWLKMPSVHGNVLDRDVICGQAAKMINRIEDLEKIAEMTKSPARLRKVGDEADTLFSSITKGRREGLKTKGETSPENIVFKILRRSGHLMRLRELKTEIYDRLNSL